MTATVFPFRAKIWLYEGPSGWHFVTLPKKTASVIKKGAAMFQKNWGSLPVKATIGHTSWDTSLFFDTRLGSYLLPLKKDIRQKEHLTAGAMVACLLHIRP